ncbi:MAG: tRNA (adenosine(37)-N6)-threonylcarbamoyltransferase complex ATPase subunit type 1 TsaE [Cyclobacteriaceae bacterium]
MIDLEYKEEELEGVAGNLLSAFSKEKVWLFNGEMGAGKTTLIKAICTELGVVDKMSSPTFSIVNEYLTESDEELYHFDFYRMENAGEAVNIGIEDYFYSGSRCFIEWPEVIMDFLPEKYLEISIKLVDDNTRHLTAKFNEPTL